MSGESIYSWVKEVPPLPEKPALYHSKHDPLAKPYKAASTFGGAAAKKAFGSIGREVGPSVAPSAFTKAHERSGPRSGELAASLPKKYVREDEPRKPSVPKRADAPLCGLKSAKDFVVANAVDAILTVPKKAPAPEPDWMHRPGFGVAPAYLEENKKEIEAQHEYIQSLLEEKQMAEEEASGVRMRELTGGERDELIDALKAKWDAANKEFQKTTFKNISSSNSTIGEIRAKLRSEATLAQIEKDIARLSVKAPIFVVDDDKVAAATAGAGRA